MHSNADSKSRYEGILTCTRTSIQMWSWRRNETRTTGTFLVSPTRGPGAMDPDIIEHPIGRARPDREARCHLRETIAQDVNAATEPLRQHLPDPLTTLDYFLYSLLSCGFAPRSYSRSGA